MLLPATSIKIRSLLKIKTFKIPALGFSANSLNHIFKITENIKVFQNPFEMLTCVWNTDYANFHIVVTFYFMLFEISYYGYITKSG